MALVSYLRTRGNESERKRRVRAGDCVVFINKEKGIIIKGDDYYVQCRNTLSAIVKQEISRKILEPQ